MRIGVDAREFKKGAYTGLRSVLQIFLTRAPEPGDHEFFLFGDQYTDFTSLPAYIRKIVLREGGTFWWDQYKLPAALRKEKIDVFFSPYIKTPLWRVCPYVNTVCDVIPLAVPKYRGVKAVLEKIHFLVCCFLCGRRSVKVITLSVDAKARISRIFGIGHDKLKVIYPSVEVSATPDEHGRSGEEVLSQYGLNRPYILYVGNFKPHKNLARLIAAFGLLPRDVRGAYSLVLAGGSAKGLAWVERVIAEHGLSGKVICVAGPDHDKLRVLLRSASVFVFPSLAEGFGMPPVEAMAEGVPVAASNLPPMTEVLGSAALFFDPYSPEDISGTVLRLLNEKDLRDQCVIRGRKRALLFNAEEMSRKILDVLEDAGLEKTLCVSSEFPPVRGGIATYIFNLWTRLPGKETVILTARARGADLWPDKRLDTVREAYPLGRDIFSRTVRTVTVTWHVWRLNRLRNIRRNHCGQVISSGIAGLIMKKIRGVPFTVYVYSGDVLEFYGGPLTRWIMRKVLAGSERIVACSRFAKNIIVERGLSEEHKVVVITPGIDTDRFGPEKGAGGIREKYGIPPEQRMLLTVSRLVRRKGHENVLYALSDIVKTHPGIVHVIVGEGAERTKLEGMVRKLGLGSNVMFTGEVPGDELVFFYNTCDIFVMAPRYIPAAGDVEGFGIVFLEANACGKPVVAGDTGGVSEAVIDGETGITVDPEDVGQIRDAILRLLADAEYAAELGAKGLSRVQKEFSWDTRAEVLRKLL